MKFLKLKFRWSVSVVDHNVHQWLSLKKICG